VKLSAQFAFERRAGDQLEAVLEAGIDKLISSRRRPNNLAGTARSAFPIVIAPGYRVSYGEEDDAPSVLVMVRSSCLA
jgi:hypothetical protein